MLAVPRRCLGSKVSGGRKAMTKKELRILTSSVLGRKAFQGESRRRTSPAKRLGLIPPRHRGRQGFFCGIHVNDYVKLAPAAAKKAVIIPGADHIYEVLTNDQSDADHVISITAEWFAKTL